MGRVSKTHLTSEMEDEEERKYRVKIDYSSAVSHYSVMELYGS